MQHKVVSNPLNHLITILDHALDAARKAGLVEVAFIVELAIAATLEATGGLGTHRRAGAT